MILLGCKPLGRLTEQHDIFFGIGRTLKELVPEMKQFWPEAKGQLHIDAWREVTVADDHKVEIIEDFGSAAEEAKKLFFINLGGYKENEFDEFHYKVLAVGASLSEATKKSKQTTFYKHYDVKGAASHVDDKYGVDVDDSYNVDDLLPDETKRRFRLKITPVENIADDVINIGYLPLSKL